MPKRKCKYGRYTGGKSRGKCRPRRTYKCKGKIPTAMKKRADAAFCADDSRFCTTGGRVRAPAGCKVVYFRNPGCRSAKTILRCDDPGGVQRAADLRWKRMKRKGDICLKTDRKGRARISSRGCPTKPAGRRRRR